MYDIELVGEILRQNFDLNAEVVFGLCQNDMPALTAPVARMIADLSPW